MEFNTFKPAHLGTQNEQRFLVEMAIHKSLSHSGIVGFLGQGRTVHGEPFFVVAYCGDRTLRKVINCHRVGLRTKLRAMLDVCDTLSYLHQRNIAHLDVKPDNVLVDDLGR